MAHHASGDAMTMAISTNLRKSLESNWTMLATLAPSTLRTPISFVRCSAVKVARANRPRHETNTVYTANPLNEVIMSRSLWYRALKDASTNEYSNGKSG